MEELILSLMLLVVLFIVAQQQKQGNFYVPSISIKINYTEHVYRVLREEILMEFHYGYADGRRERVVNLLRQMVDLGVDTSEFLETHSYIHEYIFHEP